MSVYGWRSFRLFGSARVNVHSNGKLSVSSRVGPVVVGSRGVGTFGKGYGFWWSPRGRRRRK